jgi:hypothetical protein
MYTSKTGNILLTTSTNPIMCTRQVDSTYQNAKGKLVRHLILLL